MLDGDLEVVHMFKIFVQAGIIVSYDQLDGTPAICQMMYSLFQIIYLVCLIIGFIDKVDFQLLFREMNLIARQFVISTM